MNPAPSYLIDADVLITAKNSYYAFGICPGFWSSLLHGHSHGHLHSIDRVRQELLRGPKDEDLVQWVRESAPGDFFLASDGDEIVAAYGRIILWATDNPQYRDAAKTRFAGGADGWLVAHGVVTGKTIVTNEQPRPGSRNAIKLPDVCKHFNVQVEDTFSMLHRLGVQYHYAA